MKDSTDYICSWKEEYSMKTIRPPKSKNASKAPTSKMQIVRSSNLSALNNMIEKNGNSLGISSLYFSEKHPKVIYLVQVVSSGHRSHTFLVGSGGSSKRLQSLVSLFLFCSGFSSQNIFTALGGGLSILLSALSLHISLNFFSLFLWRILLSMGINFCLISTIFTNSCSVALGAERYSKLIWSTSWRYWSLYARRFITTFKFSRCSAVSSSTLSRIVTFRNTFPSDSGRCVIFRGRSHILSCVFLARSKRCGRTRMAGRVWYNSRYNCDVENPFRCLDKSFRSTPLSAAVNDPALPGTGASSCGPTEVKSSDFDFPSCSRVNAFSAWQQSSIRSWSQQAKRRLPRTSWKKAVGSPSLSALCFLQYPDR